MDGKQMQRPPAGVQTTAKAASTPIAPDAVIDPKTAVFDEMKRKKAASDKANQDETDRVTAKLAERMNSTNRRRAN